MGNSLHLENSLVAELAERVNKARRIYGQDSAYVIGMLNLFDWITEACEGGESARQMFYGRLGEREVGRPPRSEAPAGRAATGESASAEQKGTLAENTWIKGEVKWFNNDKGYGFISTASQIDVFVHWRDISSWDRSLTQGDEVEFMVTRTAKGFQAINVMKAGSEGRSEPAAIEAEASDEGGGAADEAGAAGRGEGEEQAEADEPSAGEEERLV